MVAKRVRDLNTGDMVDGDTLGDYLSEEDAITSEYEYFFVDALIPETLGCTLIEFANGHYGLPPELIVQVAEIPPNERTDN